MHDHDHHDHDHDHDHDHGFGLGHHHHEVDLTQVNTTFILGIILNIAFVIVEGAIGIWKHALSLQADAWHNLGDVAGLALSLLAFRVARMKSNQHFTYGYRKSTILASLANAILLLIAVGVIGYEAVNRLMVPQPTEGAAMAWVAAAGILVNGFTAWLFMKGKDKELNMRGAYLHMASDAVVSLGVVIAGIVISFTGWFWLDPLISLGIMVVIVLGTWSLLRDSLRLSLDGVPSGINLDKIRAAALHIPGIRDIHHIHVWAMDTTTNALTAHLVVDAALGEQGLVKVKHTLRHDLEHLNIQHVTLETETRNCEVEDC
ncbi:cation diffusion facilitator family transporter [Dinghuibacter silviterrae]|uniref:Cobalt-zinc-cadmium efflux system protein n=1 Tax=Dinghuibacter silviterrae TaxID=1539049 RepID=A0A4R8DUH5_9BACT|nr:cation diffusion facilitator family transporter [Dinghuibacter silviterrae]TDX01067.1 cobalt-zinc-cadmium efflux system protein [Dinghuibacter silviterrae]